MVDESVPGAAAPLGGAAPRPLAAELAELADVPTAFFRGDEVVFCARERYVAVVSALKDAGFVTCSDLCAVDYLTHMDRALPPAVVGERFEIVVNLLSHSRRRYVRVRVQVPADDAVVPTLFYLYPGVENMEREAYDLFGIVFTDHPDMTRILMPQDWEGHPLRKDYGVGRVPVQFKEAPGPR